ncbi:ABC transporter substrate-binding protein [Thorsellia anophelis]|uniref:Peptide/nickel transport system substrate-binding protein n=1 Tax=Thorsellia anophelis DSM 18579 TaxID=1123402 RepID=A0A1I0ATK3_9GAMM|nr:ABC transporter substrate-binding protein [Thorsellia anophelis]SES97672.1 peptide/nickel transport system substrate-binding protein [Thorsellia anophelis DSM 18579]
MSKQYNQKPISIILKTIFATALGSIALFNNAYANTPADTLIVVQPLDDIVSLDPAESFELSSIQTLPSLYQRLVQANRDKPEEIEPDLATRYDIDADNKTITFYLDPNAKFASQNKVSSDDVIYSLTRAVKLNKAPAFILNVLGFDANNVDGLLTKIDDSTFKLTWTADIGAPVVLSVLTSPIASIVDSKVVQENAQADDYGNKWLSTHAAGGGPFILKSYQPQNVILLENSPIDTKIEPALKSVIIKNVPDANARKLQIEKNDADIARSLTSDQYDALKSVSSVNVVKFPSAEVDYIAFNTGNLNNPVLSNPALWEAARYLVDYDGLTQTLLNGHYTTHQAFLPAGFPYASVNQPFKFDPEKAKSILKAANIDSPTIKLEIENRPPFLQIGQALQASFKAGGVNLELIPSATSQLYAKIRNKEHEAALRFWIPDYFDAHSNASTFAYYNEAVGSTAKINGWVIPELSQKTQQAVSTSDTALRDKLYQEIQTTVQNESPFIFFMQANNSVALNPTVKGYYQGLNADMVYYDKITKE